MEQNTWNMKSELSKISTHVASSPVCFDISHLVRVQHILRLQNRAGSPFLGSPPLLRISLPGCLAGGWGLCSCQCSRWKLWCKPATARPGKGPGWLLWPALIKSSFSCWKRTLWISLWQDFLPTLQQFSPVSARYLAISLVCSVVEKLVFITGTSYFKEGLAKCRNTLTFTLFHVQFLFFSMARQKDKVFLLVTLEKLSLGKWPTLYLDIW